MDEIKRQVLEIVNRISHGDPRYWLQSRFIPRMVRWDVVIDDLKKVFEEAHGQTTN